MRRRKHRRWHGAKRKYRSARRIVRAVLYPIRGGIRIGKMIISAHKDHSPL